MTTPEDIRLLTEPMVDAFRSNLSVNQEDGGYRLFVGMDDRPYGARVVFQIFHRDTMIIQSIMRVTDIQKVHVVSSFMASGEHLRMILTETALQSTR